MHFSRSGLLTRDRGVAAPAIAHAQLRVAQVTHAVLEVIGARRDIPAERGINVLERHGELFKPVFDNPALHICAVEFAGVFLLIPHP